MVKLSFVQAYDDWEYSTVRRTYCLVLLNCGLCECMETNGIFCRLVRVHFGLDD